MVQLWDILVLTLKNYQEDRISLNSQLKQSTILFNLGITFCPYECEASTSIDYQFSFYEKYYHIIIYKTNQVLEDPYGGGLVYQMYGKNYAIAYGSYGFNGKLGGRIFERS